MSLGSLILADVRLSARRAHRSFREGRPDKATPLTERITLLLAGLREDYSTGEPFHQLVREAVRLGLPQAYVADLFVHDRRKLEMMEAEGGPLAFLWVIYDCGTNLLEARGSDPTHMADSFRRRYHDCHVYIFKDGELTECLAASGTVA
jgi:hypothetical protein